MADSFTSDRPCPQRTMYLYESLGVTPCSYKEPVEVWKRELFSLEQTELTEINYSWMIKNLDSVLPRHWHTAIKVLQIEILHSTHDSQPVCNFLICTTTLECCSLLIGYLRPFLTPQMSYLSIFF